MASSDSSPFLIRTADAIRGLGRYVPGARALVDGLGTRIRNRPIVIPFGVGRGLRFCARDATAAHALGLAETPIQKTLSDHLSPGDTFYDLGANVGFFTLIAARLVGPSGQVYAFEPAPDTADALRSNVSRNGFDHVTVLEYAVSDRSGTARLLVGSASPLSRLAETSGPLAGSSQQVDVQTVALDRLIAEQSLRPPTLLKIDIEGAEIDALRGMGDTIVQHRPTILCELHDTAEAFAEAMRPYGYDLHVVEVDRPLAEVPPKEADRLHVLARPRPVR